MINRRSFIRRALAVLAAPLACACACARKGIKVNDRPIETFPSDGHVAITNAHVDSFGFVVTPDHWKNVRFHVTAEELRERNRKMEGIWF